MAILNALKKAPILDQDGAIITAPAYSVTTSDPLVAPVSYPGYQWHVSGLAAGLATITATRTLDGAVAVLEVEVVAPAPFAISLGAEVPA